MKARIPFVPNKRQKEILHEEINKRIAEANERYSADVDALMLYVLHEKYGFGKKRLREFYDRLQALWHHLSEFYNMPSSEDNIWICRQKLLDIGVDVANWNKEKATIEMGGDK